MWRTIISIWFDIIQCAHTGCSWDLSILDIPETSHYLKPSNLLNQVYKWSLAWENVSPLITFNLDISSRSFSHDFAIKLWKYVTSCCVHHRAHSVLDGFFPYLAQMITSKRWCVMHHNLWPWPISSRSFSHDFALKLLKYGTSCHVHSTAGTVLEGFFPYLAQMIASMRQYVDRPKVKVTRKLLILVVRAGGILADHQSMIIS